MLRALVNLSHKQNDVSQIASYLLGIFSAIQKADDAVDAIYTHVCYLIFVPNYQRFCFIAFHFLFLDIDQFFLCRNCMFCQK